MKEQIFKNAVKIAHDILYKKVEKGDIVVDATVGNGYDTVVLADLVGEKGKVYGFDIQDTALLNTKKKLNYHNLLERVKLIKDSHENLNLYVNEKIDLVIFNLGYLPGGDHSIITKPKSTITAIEKSIQKLADKGLIIIVIYTGHEGGTLEKKTIEEYVEKLNQRQYSVIKYSFINQINNPPEVIVIEKK